MNKAVGSASEERIAHFKKYGFDCLIFWEYDAWVNEEMIVQRISDAVRNSVVMSTMEDGT